MVWSLEFPLGVWYDLQDDGPDGENSEQNYGLVDANGAAKPPMQAVRTAMAAVKGRRYSGNSARAVGDACDAIRWAGGCAVHCLEREGGKATNHPLHKRESGFCDPI